MTPEPGALQAPDRRTVLSAGALGMTSLCLPSASASASIPTVAVADTFTVAAVADRTVRVIWSESAYTDTIEYRPADADADDPWATTEAVTSPADVVTTAGWATTATSRAYDVRIRTSSGGVSVVTDAKEVTSVAAATGGDAIDLINVDVEGASVLHRVHRFDRGSRPSVPHVSRRRCRSTLPNPSRQ